MAESQRARALTRGLLGAPTPLEVVKVKNDGGEAGGSTTGCTFTYSIYPATTPELADKYRLAQALTPLLARTELGAYAAADEGSYGLAFRLGGTWRLVAALRERPLVAMCNPDTVE
jgi:hypothetical protein